MSTPCRVRVTGAWRVGSPCPACGHTDFAHPGAPNPALDACVICELVGLARDVAPGGPGVTDRR